MIRGVGREQKRRKNDKKVLYFKANSVENLQCMYNTGKLSGEIHVQVETRIHERIISVII